MGHTRHLSGWTASQAKGEGSAAQLAGTDISEITS
jgi:hypothetical protein